MPSAMGNKSFVLKHTDGTSNHSPKFVAPQENNLVVLDNNLDVVSNIDIPFSTTRLFLVTKETVGFHNGREELHLVNIMSARALMCPNIPDDTIFVLGTSADLLLLKRIGELVTYSITTFKIIHRMPFTNISLILRLDSPTKVAIRLIEGNPIHIVDVRNGNKREVSYQQLSTVRQIKGSLLLLQQGPHLFEIVNIETNRVFLRIEGGATRIYHTESHLYFEHREKNSSRLKVYNLTTFQLVYSLPPVQQKFIPISEKIVYSIVNGEAQIWSLLHDIDPLRVESTQMFLVSPIQLDDDQFYINIGTGIIYSKSRHQLKKAEKYSPLYRLIMDESTLQYTILRKNFVDINIVFTL